MLPVLGKKAVLEWCMKEGLIGSLYVCPKCGKSRELRERTAVVSNTITSRKRLPCHDEFRGPRSDYIRQVALATTTTLLFDCFLKRSNPVPLKTRRVGQRCTLNLSRAETSSRWCGVVVRRGGASSGVRPRHLTMVQNYVVHEFCGYCSLILKFKGFGMKSNVV
ncbi:uncharacterized protein TNCV_1940871 [Trichonephila clavipes]|nr:uncharacterized protein TNCV_1940871 [Trichonephila clavipes]